MRAIEQCRTSALGGHVDQCDACGFQRVSYNSCRNRHCPKCQSLAQARWVAARQAELLPVEYFHVVFTLPEQLAMVALQNQRVVYNLLFAAVAKTLRTIAADPKHLGAEIGFLAVLHTWGQNLLHHPHLHCVVPGGGLAADKQRWLSCRRGFFVSVKVLSRLFRRLFLEALAAASEQGKLSFHGSLEKLAEPTLFKRLLANVRRLEWNVYAKPPFGGPEQVLDYLGRYTHRVAISNHRLIAFENGTVTFRWKDYRRGNQQRVMTLTAEEFMRRFLLHTLPRGFQRLRHFGLLSNRARAAKLAHCRQLLGVSPTLPLNAGMAPPADYATHYQTLTGVSLTCCPVCQRGQLRTTALLAPLAQLRQPREQNHCAHPP
jgi:Putative transposase/Transposase zinc-binding domain